MRVFPTRRNINCAQHCKLYEYENKWKNFPASFFMWNMKVSKRIFSKVSHGHSKHPMFSAWNTTCYFLKKKKKKELQVWNDNLNTDAFGKLKFAVNNACFICFIAIKSVGKLEKGEMY